MFYTGKDPIIGVLVQIAEENYGPLIRPVFGMRWGVENVQYKDNGGLVVLRGSGSRKTKDNERVGRGYQGPHERYGQ